jgi:hypothetical protein
MHRVASTQVPFMPGESTREFLDRRERELTNQLAAARADVSRIEMELVEVQRAKAAIQSAPLHEAFKAVTATESVGSALAVISKQRARDERYAHMTIKELVVQALLDKFRDGASAVKIRDFIQDAYGRDIMPASLRPQMHRLKAAGQLLHYPDSDQWKLSLSARRGYSMYDHPSSRRAMPELQDDPDDNVTVVTEITAALSAVARSLRTKQPSFVGGASSHTQDEKIRRSERLFEIAADIDAIGENAGRYGEYGPEKLLQYEAAVKAVQELGAHVDDDLNKRVHQAFVKAVP